MSAYQAVTPEGNYWQSDDEASMGDSDDNELPQDLHISHLESNDLGIQVARRLEAAPDAYGVRMRTVSSFADTNVLDTYTPSSMNSPLNDSQTAAVFWYFVNVTGQSMSLYERHPFDPTPMFQGQPVPKARRHIWTCKCRDRLEACQEEDSDHYARYFPNYGLQPSCFDASDACAWQLADGKPPRGAADGRHEALSPES